MELKRRKSISTTCALIAIFILWVWLFNEAGGWLGITDALTAMIIASIVGLIGFVIVAGGVMLATAIAGTSIWFITFGLLSVIFADID